jgi:AbrB family looped-hinge helix DNA binding protein
MSEFTGKVQALGRVAIPKDLREANGIKEGDLVVVNVRKVK